MQLGGVALPRCLKPAGTAKAEEVGSVMRILLEGGISVSDTFRIRICPGSRLLDYLYAYLHDLTAAAAILNFSWSGSSLTLDFLSPYHYYKIPLTEVL